MRSLVTTLLFFCSFGTAWAEMLKPYDKIKPVTEELYSDCVKNIDSDEESFFKSECGIFLQGYTVGYGAAIEDIKNFGSDYTPEKQKIKENLQQNICRNGNDNPYEQLKLMVKQFIAAYERIINEYDPKNEKFAFKEKIKSMPAAAGFYAVFYYTNTKPTCYQK